MTTLRIWFSNVRVNSVQVGLATGTIETTMITSLVIAVLVFHFGFIVGEVFGTSATFTNLMTLTKAVVIVTSEGGATRDTIVFITISERS